MEFADDNKAIYYHYEERLNCKPLTLLTEEKEIQ